VTPDVLVMGLAFWTIGRLANELQHPHAVGRYMATGALGGAAYLAKSHFLPWSR
jgi:hypothetical protein